MTSSKKNLSQTFGSSSTSNLDQTLSSSSSTTSNLNQTQSNSSSDTSNLNYISSSSSSNSTINLKQTFSSSSSRSDTSTDDNPNKSSSKEALPLGSGEPSAQGRGANIHLLRDRILKQLQSSTQAYRDRSTSSRHRRRESTDCSNKAADPTAGSEFAGRDGKHGRRDSSDCSSKAADAAPGAGTPSHSIWDSQPLSAAAGRDGKHGNKETTGFQSKILDAVAGTPSHSIWDSQPFGALAARDASGPLTGKSRNLGTLAHDYDNDDARNQSDRSQNNGSESRRESGGLSPGGGGGSVRDLARGKCSIGLMNRNRAVHDPPIFHTMYLNRATSRCFGGLTTFQNRATMLGGPGIICEAHSQCSVCKQTEEGGAECTVLLCFLDDPDKQCQLPAVICARCSKSWELRGQLLKGRVLMPMREAVGNFASSCIDSAIKGVTFREARD